MKGSSPEEAAIQERHLVLALGNFDGVHRGHQQMLSLTVGLAQKLDCAPGVYTFEPNPVKILSAAKAPALLQTLSQKIRHLRQCGIQKILVEPFTLTFAALSPEEFFETILIERLQVKGVVVGYDFTFGSKRSGNAELLGKLCHAHAIPFQKMEPYLLDGVRVSSTEIRRRVAQGEIESANRFLGYPFELIGEVVAGEQIGRTLGFPTANLKVENELIPARGVYATQAVIEDQVYPSITNIGLRPTFGGEKVQVETHLFDFQQSLYGRRISLCFLKKIREEKKFESSKALIEQIQKDLKIAQEALSSHSTR